MLSLLAARRKYEGYNSESAHALATSRSTSTRESQPDATDESGDAKERDEQKRKEADPFYVSFQGDDDPQNPRNWSSKKKWSVLVLVSSVTWVVTLSSAVFSGSTMIVSKLYGISVETAELGTALYLCGFGVGPLFFGPMSEAVGRSPVYLATFLFFILMQLGPLLGQNPQAIFISRFFAGFFGSSPLSNAGGSISDMFDALDRTMSFPFFAAMPFLGPILAPLISGACAESGIKMWDSIIDWRSIYWLTMVLGFAVFVVSLLFLPETQAPAILKLKASAVRRQTGDKRFYCDIDQRKESNFKLIVTASPKPIMLLFTEPIILALSTYLLVIYAILYMNIEGYSFLFANDYYKFNLVEVGLAFIPIGVGVVLCGATAPLQWLDYRSFFRQAVKEGKPMASPEIRLRALMFGGILIPVGVFWLAWTARPGIYWAAPVLAGVPFGAGFLFAFLDIYQYLIDCYGDLAASALAAATLFRYLGAGGLVMVVNPLYKNLAYSNVSGQMIYAWPLSLLGFLSILCVPIPWVLYLGAGKWLRQRSPHCVKF